ncbi:MAG: 16S rRNA (uracil(1498)-N(3))-methyltransferase [Alphaproteobacteria bacterium]
MASDFTKLSRLYSDRNFSPDATVTLEVAQAHYLKNVMRLKIGDFLRLFNGRDGEWLASITALGKNECSVTLKGKIREQPPKSAEMHILFAPIKKDRMDILVEKAVELGATALHPVLTNRTIIRKINEDRIRAQVLEAAEQCERFEIPVLYPLADLKQKITGWKHAAPILWCCERGESPHISTFQEQSWAFLIGPEGGFDDNEFTFLNDQPKIKPMTLGETILRAETAAILALGYAKMKGLK